MARSECTTMWSSGGQIYFLDGQAWGLTKGLVRIILGKEGDIRKAMVTGKSGNGTVDNIIKEDAALSTQTPF